MSNLLEFSNEVTEIVYEGNAEDVVYVDFQNM